MSMTTAFCMAVAAILGWAGMWLSERRHKRRLSKRKPADWDAIASAYFAEPAERAAVSIVLESITECMGIAPNRIHPDDDIDEDYRIPGFWGALAIDDPGYTIILTIEERIEEEYTPWNSGTCGSEVRDIIENVAAHLQGKVPTFLGPCASCGYNLRGLTELRCPECGTPFGAGLLKRND